jgi:hypothetical protein
MQYITGGFCMKQTFQKGKQEKNRDGENHNSFSCQPQIRSISSLRVTFFPHFYWLHLLTHKSYWQRDIPQLQDMNKKISITIPLAYLDLGAIISSPPMKGLNGSGMITEPSSCW